MKIELWGNALAVRIPEEMATSFRLKEDDEVAIIVKRSWLHFEGSDDLYQPFSMLGDTRLT